MGPTSLRAPNWEAIRAADPDAPGRYGWGLHIVHKAHPLGGVTSSVCNKKRCTLAVKDWSFVTCALCLRALPVVGHLKDGTPVFYGREP